MSNVPFRWVEMDCRCCDRRVTVSPSWTRDYSACPDCVEAGCTEVNCFRPEEEPIRECGA